MKCIVHNEKEFEKALQDKIQKIEIEADSLCVSKSIELYSNLEIIGKNGTTKIVLKENSNCHVFRSVAKTNNIKLHNLYVVGNSKFQNKPQNVQEVAYCCGIYLKDVHSADIKNCVFIDIKQTAVHCSGSTNIVISGCYTEHVGWSGFSTFKTDQYVLSDSHSIDSGCDTKHSAIHIDGGSRIYIKNLFVEQCTGNGIMIDSTAAPIDTVSIENNFVTKAHRGISLSGKSESSIHNLLIQKNNINYCEEGIMSANASNINILENVICHNGIGLHLQGRKGVDHVTVYNNKFLHNHHYYQKTNTVNNDDLRNNVIVNIKTATISPKSFYQEEKLALKHKYKDLPVSFQDRDGNTILGDYKNKDLEVTFKGKNNILILNKPRNIVNGKIDFQGSDGCVFIDEGSDLKGRTRLGTACFLHIGKKLALGGAVDFRLAEKKTIYIGDDCMFAQKVLISTDDTHPIFDAFSKTRVNPSKDIFIGNHVWLGEGSRILKGTELSDGCVVGMYSFLSNKRYENNCVIVGTPARVVKRNIVWEKNFLNDGDKDYTNYNNTYKSSKYYLGSKMKDDDK